MIPAPVPNDACRRPSGLRQGVGEEGADADREPGPPPVRVDVADGAAVRPARYRLEFGDHLLARGSSARR